MLDGFQQVPEGVVMRFLLRQLEQAKSFILGIVRHIFVASETKT
jgi:hypothetical protein